MNVRLSAVLGVVLAVVGLAALAVPGLTTGLPTGETLVSVLGGLLALGGLREVNRRRTTAPSYAETGDAEQTMSLPTPGAEFDRRLDRLAANRYRVTERNRLREEMTDVGVATLRRRFEYDEDEAEGALRGGAWTDDPYAAAFFSGRTPRLDPLSQVREFFRPGASFRRRARRAVDELYRLAEGDPEADEEGAIDE